MIRRFAMERLVESGAAGEIHRRHVIAFRELSEKAAPQLVRAGQKAWLDRLADDHDNIRAALAWALENGMDDEAYRIVAAVWRFWQIRGHVMEGAERVGEVLQLEPTDPRLRIGALEAAGGLGYWRGTLEFAGHYAEAVDIARATDDRSALAKGLINLSFAKALEDPDAALRDLDEAEAIYRQAGDWVGLGRVQWARGNVLAAIGEADQAGHAFEESVEAFAGTDFLFDRAWAAFSLAFARLQGGDGEGVEEVLAESLAMFLASDDVSGVVMHVAGFAAAALVNGETRRAYRRTRCSAPPDSGSSTPPRTSFPV